MQPKLAVTMGDPAGIGPEIAVKTLVSSAVYERALPFVIGSVEMLEVAARQCGVELTFERVDDVDAVHRQEGVVSVLEPVTLDASAVEIGAVSASAGHAAVSYFETAVELALAGRIAGVVTCPINKQAVHAAGYIGDIGHQEILARMTGAELTATMLITEGLRVAHLSTHKSLADAVAYVRQPVLVEKITLTAESLQRWGIAAPRIGVAALNPHGGEGGMLGREEIDELAPAVATLRERGFAVSGPWPADSIFYRAINGEFDAVFALFHDQGHIAIKVHNFEQSITATMGIPFIRTSVDHGTAFDIAGQNKADASGLGVAIDAAIDMMNGTYT